MIMKLGIAKSITQHLSMINFGLVIIVINNFRNNNININ